MKILILALFTCLALAKTNTTAVQIKNTVTSICAQMSSSLALKYKEQQSIAKVFHSKLVTQTCLEQLMSHSVDCYKKMTAQFARKSKELKNTIQIQLITDQLSIQNAQCIKRKEEQLHATFVNMVKKAIREETSKSNKAKRSGQ